MPQPGAGFVEDLAEHHRYQFHVDIETRVIACGHGVEQMTLMGTLGRSYSQMRPARRPQVRDSAVACRKTIKRYRIFVIIPTLNLSEQMSSRMVRCSTRALGPLCLMAQLEINGNVIGRSSCIERSRDSSSQCGHFKRRLQRARMRCSPRSDGICASNAKPDRKQPMIVRRILPQMIVLAVFCQIVSGLAAITHMNAPK